MKITHVGRSKFRNPIIRRLRKTHFPGGPGSVVVRLPPVSRGYEGKFEVEIRSKTEKTFQAHPPVADPSRLPARIRAAARALRDEGHLGRFSISHKDGDLTITKI